ncbi:MAG: WYL domain-containing protein [Alphaproteobacteria bacterium]|nr:WYL domain-containing protein [Alphaproteobacteria bacterium]
MEEPLSHPSLDALPLDALPLVVVDLETTGLSVEEGHRIVEVAAVQSGPEGEARWSQLVDPCMTMPADSYAVHGIGDRLLDGAPTIDAVLPELRRRIEGRVLVAHHAPFDLGFLAAACARIGQPPVQPAAVVDTLLLARVVFGLIHCSLPELAARVGAPHDPPHRALPDAVATLHLFRAMAAELGDQAPTLGELVALPQRLAKGGELRTVHRRALQQALLDGHDVVIDYSSGAGGALSTRRRIRVTRLRSPYVEAWCHLRGAERVFKLSRIRRVAPAPEPAPGPSED